MLKFSLISLTNVGANNANADAVVLLVDASEEGYDVHFDVNPPSTSCLHQSVRKKRKIK